MVPDREKVERDKDEVQVADEKESRKKLLCFTSASTKPISATELANQVSEDIKTMRTQISLDTVIGQETRVLVLYTGGTIGMKCEDGGFRLSFP
ncbi:unnamed protein product [Gongylonema pulchrum]|uniref:Asparaginase n=1 Tax=Gongylonema pulchrum TaxID=637853 RepID=A0A183EGX4_9BILA|nr:unnamed protein product [Gongylonema pulchrum]